MNKMTSVTIAAILSLCLLESAYAQRIQVSDVLIVSAPDLSNIADTSAYLAYVTDEVATAWTEQLPGTELHLLRADRGRQSGALLIVWTAASSVRESFPAPSDDLPFSRDVLRDTGLIPANRSDLADAIVGYTEYELVEADVLDELPAVDLLGFHYVQVKPGLEQSFESFVSDTLYEALAGRTPGMDLLYYRGVRGEGAGSYVLLFAIESPGAREHYWPTGAPETEATKQAFEPLKPVALALSSYLVEGSYLEPRSGAAAAYIESLDWTDYVHVHAEKP